MTWQSIVRLCEVGLGLMEASCDYAGQRRIKNGGSNDVPRREHEWICLHTEFVEFLALT